MEIQQPAGLPCLCQCQQRTREKGKKQPICSPRSLPSLLFVWVLSGQRGAACRLVLGFFEARAAMFNCGFLCVCVRVCVSVQACLNSAEFSYHSSAGPADALGLCLFFSHLLRFLSIFSFSMTHTHKQESRSDLEKEKEAWLLGSCVAERYLRSDWTNSSSSPWASVSLKFSE